jgi:DNA-binding CsgD family transcriptional regulator/pimeloyl-ACP methyl ester carboxylesterase
MPVTRERVDDLHAVMDAAGSERAAVVGISEGAPLAITFAVANPERVSALILYAPLPKGTRSADYPWAMPADWWKGVAITFENSWGSPEYMEADVAWRAPSESGNPAFVKWWGVYRRLGASPGAAADLTRLNARIDVRALLPKVRAPTLVLARAGDRVISPEHARYVAQRVEGATYLEQPGDDHLPFVGDASAFVTAIARMLGVQRDVRVEKLVDPQPAGEAAATTALTERERDVLSWVARGKTNAEIATALYITESTVRKHLQNSYKKLGVSNRTAAAALLRDDVH